MVTGLPNIKAPSNPCEGCILGKHHRDSFSIRNSRRAKQSLELVHTDIYGPVEVESIGHKRYFFYFSWMIIQEKYGYMFLEKNQKHSTSSKNSKLLLKSNVDLI